MKDVRHMFIVKTCGKKGNLRLFLEREGNKKCPLEHLLPCAVSVYEDILEVDCVTSSGLP